MNMLMETFVVMVMGLEKLSPYLIRWTDIDLILAPSDIHILELKTSKNTLSRGLGSSRRERPLINFYHNWWAC